MCQRRTTAPCAMCHATHCVCVSVHPRAGVWVCCSFLIYFPVFNLKPIDNLSLFLWQRRERPSTDCIRVTQMQKANSSPSTAYHGIWNVAQIDFRRQRCSIPNGMHCALANTRTDDNKAPDVSAFVFIKPMFNKSRDEVRSRQQEDSKNWNEFIQRKISASSNEWLARALWWYEKYSWQLLLQSTVTIDIRHRNCCK